MAPSIVSNLLSRTVTFKERWVISNEQSPHITCLEVSACGPWLASASEDCTLLFADVYNGAPIGIVDLEHHYYIMCVLWRTSSSLIFGGSNGVVYEAMINPRNALHPFSMFPIIGPLTDQVRAIAFDSSGLHSVLAVAHGTRVSIFAQTLPGHDWNKIDDVLEPCHDQAGLVTALFFFGRKERKLFIGYAEEGWSILRYGSSSEVQRFDPRHYPNDICRIGQARISPDQQTVTISTLDQSVVTYALGDNGPILESAKEFPLQVARAANPILPVAHTSSGMILGGTSMGDIPIVRSQKPAVPRLYQGEGHLIRCITPRNDDIFVASSGPQKEVTIRCFTDAGKFTKPAWLRASGTRKPFRITLTDALVMSTEAHKRTAPIQTEGGVLGQILQSRDTKILVGLMSFVLVLVLSSSPPGGESYQASQAPATRKGVVIASPQRSGIWVEFGVRYFVGYFCFQVYGWLNWTWSVVHDFISHILGFPKAFGDVLLMSTAKWICERVEVYRKLDICPKFQN